MADRPTPSGLVLVVGPDGAGKTTVVDAITRTASASGIPVARAHHRPGVIAGRPDDAGPVVDPHAKSSRSFAASLAKLLVVFGDHLVGGHTRWRGQRRKGILLLERGWFDMLVDPRRYRLQGRLGPLVRLLGRCVPRPDLVLLLTGDAQRLHDRKPEIGVAEVARQIEQWRHVAPEAGRRVLEVDTIVTGADQATGSLLAELAAPRWRRVPLTPRRLDLVMTGDARAGLAVYQPQSRRARSGAAVARSGVRLSTRAVPEPLADLDDLWCSLGLDPSGVVAMRSSTPGRHVLALCHDGRMDVVVKVGTANDHRLRQEATMLSTPLRAGLPVQRPVTVWSGEWHDHVVVATRAIRRSSRTPWSVTDVVPIARALGAAGTDGAPLTHGDLAPWNLVRTSSGPILLDWESARWSDEPLHDLAHFVVQAGALLGRYPPHRAVALLSDPGSPGVELLEGLGRAAVDARPQLDAYLAQARPTDPRVIRFCDDMLRLVTR